jgi:hypothetical protein
LIRKVDNVDFIRKITNHKTTKKLSETPIYILTINDSNLYEKVNENKMNRIEKFINYLKRKKEKSRIRSVKLEAAEK